MAWLDGSGYMRCWHPRNPKKKVYVARLVLEQKLGRPLTDDEQAHHIDGDRFNNAPENLTVMLIGEHQSHDNRRRAPARRNANGTFKKGRTR